MLRMLDHATPRDLLRWLLYTAFLALTIAVAPDYWAAERLSFELQAVRGLGTLAMLVLTVLLVRARHERPLRKLPFQASIVTLMLLEAALKIGLNVGTVALLAVWVAVVVVEWRRLADDERRFT